MSAVAVARQASDVELDMDVASEKAPDAPPRDPRRTPVQSPTAHCSTSASSPTSSSGPPLADRSFLSDFLLTFVLPLLFANKPVPPLAREQSTSVVMPNAERLWAEEAATAGPATGGRLLRVMWKLNRRNMVVGALCSVAQALLNVVAKPLLLRELVLAVGGTSDSAGGMGQAMDMGWTGKAWDNRERSCVSSAPNPSPSPRAQTARHTTLHGYIPPSPHYC
jgi:hypothetical protein